MICSGLNAATGEPVSVEFGERIRQVMPAEPGPGDLWIAPGFIDIQINGFLGVDFNNPKTSIEGVARAVETVLRTGVTRMLPTVITAAPEDMVACLRTLHLAQEMLRLGRTIVGFHVEGPHIGAEDGPRGAHPAQWVRPPDFEEFLRWQEATHGNIRLVTLSPHWPETPAYIRAVTGAGAVVSIGHTAANADQIRAAVDAGATLSTHLGNAAPRMLPKQPNCLWDQLAEDRLSASFIVDGRHLDNAFLRAAVRAKGVRRTILVTDAAAPAGARPGQYRLGEQAVELTTDDRVVLAGTAKLAGSALRMNGAISNLMKTCGLSLREAMETATTNPARLLEIEGRTQGLEPGERGDIVTFRPCDGALEIVEVYQDGELIGTADPLEPFFERGDGPALPNRP